MFVPLFDPASVIDAIERHEVDWTVMVPTMIAMLLDHPSFRPERLASLRDLVYGASPMPAGSARHGCWPSSPTSTSGRATA